MDKQAKIFQKLLKDYWLVKFAGVEAVRAGSEEQASRSLVRECVRVRIPAAAAERIRELAANNDTAEYVIYLAFFHILLYKYYSAESFCVATPDIRAGKDAARENHLLFFKLGNISATTSIKQVLKNTLQEVRETISRKDFDFADFQQALARNGEDTAKLFQFGINSNRVNARSEVFDQVALQLRLDESEPNVAGRTLEIAYNPSMHDGPWVEQLAAHYRSLVSRVESDLDEAVQSLPLLSADETRRLLVEFNDTRADYAPGLLHELFERQAGRTPDAVAVVCGNESLTYAELDARANQLAHHLRGLGVGAESLVAVCAERSAAMVVALLGVLKAGGAYVPLDPAYPRERLAFMLSDSRASVLLTQERLLDKLSGAAAARVVCLDADREDIAAQSADSPRVPVCAESPAYVIYTSGSTGRPKGVVISHSAICNHMTWMQAALPLDEADAVLQKTPFSFDASVWEFYAPLLAGARLVMAAPGGHQDGSYLVRIIEEERITILQTVPSLLRMLLAAPGLRRCQTLRRVFCGGEPLTRDLQEAFYEQLDAVTLYNLYGPTEATIEASAWECERGSKRRVVPIGRPISNTQMYVLDKHRRPVPQGTVGELYIGGAGLARCYLNRPELTAEKFVPNPFGEEPGARLYRTGDLARHLPDGALEFLGRADQQVKVRGYRVELGEIENCLMSYEKVREAVVVAREEESGASLAAYFVPNATPPTAAELRAHLRAQLPEYMLPAFFVLLDKLPITPSGKVDRRALPAPEGIDLDGGGRYLAPQSEIERELAKLWGAVLGRERVGLDDDFFDLGGHSLKATRLISLLHKQLGFKVPLRALFANPTLRDFAALVAGSGGRDDYQSISPVAAQPHYPLSHAQKRLWILDQLESRPVAYTIAGAFIIEGALDAPALGRALHRLIDRHESLRTVFITVDGEPRQRILATEQTGFTLQYSDLRHLPDAREQAQQLIESAMAMPFDLERGPLFHAHLIQTGARDFLLFLSMHHIIGDGWSTNVMVEEVLAFYEARPHGADAPLPIQYKDYAAWQSARMGGEAMRSHRRYWHETLSGELPVLELPTDYARASLKSYAGASVRLALDSAMTARLRELSRRHDASLYMTLLAAVKVLLFRYTGQTDLIMGVPVAGREHAELEGQIGFYVNTLAIRTHLKERASFGDTLNEMSRTLLDSYAHQEYPFDLLVEELATARDLSRSPLFDVMAVMRNADQRELRGREVAGLHVDTYEMPVRVSKFDLTWWFEERTGGELEVVIEYNTSLFRVERIERLARHYEILLTSAANDETKTIGEIEYLSAGEREELLRKWSDGARAEWDAHTVVELFERQVEQTPESIAVVWKDRQLSYADLNAQANQLAHYLRRIGVGPESAVAVLLERSIEMVVCVLGILKAGGAYVPLDPQHPHERLAFMIRDTDARAFVTSRRLASRAPQTAVPALTLDADWEAAVATESRSNPRRVADAANLAYILYTSGSTGQPKGVMVSHGGLGNYLNWAVRAYDAGRGAGAPMHTALGFDLTVTSLFAPLITGRSVTLIGEDESPSTLLDTSRRRGRYDLVKLTPAHLELLAHEAGNHDLSDWTHTLVIGGDALFGESLGFLQQRAPETRLINEYGPTETVVGCCVYEAPPGANLKGPVPIGRPIANTQLYVLDARMQPVAAGVPGELYIGGEGLAHGYRGRTSLTAERFIPHSFGDREGARLYRTGDRVRWLDDGTLEYLGRLDQQIKIRGYRIEPGEVENALLQHPAVNSALVMARRDAEGVVQLVAYITGLAGSPPPLETAHLRAHLKTRLPDYMIPSSFVQLDEFPLSVNGKVNRNLLPAPEHHSGMETTGAAAAYVAPRNELEARLAAIWEEVLGRPRVSVTDNFFEIGGHSLRAVRVMSGIAGEFQLKVELRTIFEHPTVASLAVEIASHTQREEDVIEPVPARDFYEASHAQKRLWILQQLSTEQSAYNISGAFVLEGEVDRAAFENAFRALIARHESLRTTFHLVGDEPKQKINAPASLPFALAYVDLRGEPDGVAASHELARQDAAAPFDLETGPLVRASLIQLSEARFVFLFSMHHIISDGWSMGILFDEVLTLYAALKEGREHPLPPLRIQYKDYAVWQNNQLRGEKFDALSSYWIEKLGESPPVLALPLDYPRPPAQSFAGDHVSFVINRETTSSLVALAARSHTTLFTVLFAAYNVLLHHLTGQRTMILGTSVAGRNHSELESLIGFFINTLAVRTDIDPQLSFTALLETTHRNLLEDFEHQEMPFDLLVPLLKLKRDPAISPVFQSRFVFDDFEYTRLLSPGAHASDIAVVEVFTESSTAKFDLSTTMHLDGDQLAANIEYRSDLFKRATVERLGQRFETLLRHIIASPEERLDRFDIQTSGEREESRRRKEKMRSALFTPNKRKDIQGPSSAGERL